MVLNDEQNELFFDTMDSLLYYVNERFRVVEDLKANIPKKVVVTKTRSGSSVALEL